MEGISIRAMGMSAKFQSTVVRVNGLLETEGSKAVEAQVHSIRQLVIATTPVDTGNLKSRWGSVGTRGHLAYGFGTDVYYAPTLEYGGYMKVGPRTIQLGGGDLGAGFVADAGIYSRQAPLGFVRKALAQSVGQFQLRIRNVLRQGWGGLGSGDSPEDPPPIQSGWGGGRQTAVSVGGVNPQVLHQIMESLTRRSSRRQTGSSTLVRFRGSNRAAPFYRRGGRRRGE